ncbi:pilus assembly protein [Myxococcota bacterium]|nr:pilus assembly protein [Myxococcota bacterium]
MSLSSLHRRARRDRRGSNAVEFALILPILILLFAGIVEWGWTLNQQMMVVQAAREGARAGVSTPRDDDPETAAEARAVQALNDMGLNGSAAVVTATITGAYPDELLQVSLALPHQPIIGLVPIPVDLKAALTMRLEEQVAP